MDDAENAVGASRHLGHLDERRRDWHSPRAPDQFAGRVELTEAEFADKLKRDEATRKRSDATCGAFCNDNAWLKKSFNQTSLIIDGDGKTPAADAAGRVAPGAARPRHVRQRPVREHRRTSRTTTAASRAASSGRSCRSSTATATASCRRRTKS